MARYYARLSDPVHVAAWVDDLLFSMSTPEHAACAGFDGGCAVCIEAHSKALEVQEAWLEKARALNIPLSAKDHNVGQRGVYTRVAIDMFSGRFSMLPEKLQSMTDARNALAASPLSTPRLIAKVRSSAITFAAHAQP